jgi:hypothetical protein
VLKYRCDAVLEAIALVCQRKKLAALFEESEKKLQVPANGSPDLGAPVVRHVISFISHVWLWPQQRAFWRAAVPPTRFSSERRRNEFPVKLLLTLFCNWRNDRYCQPVGRSRPEKFILLINNSIYLPCLQRRVLGSGEPRALATEYITTPETKMKLHKEFLST